jgi:predicted TIM-barrel fold metal-dependent hydrolase
MSESETTIVPPSRAGKGARGLGPPLSLRDYALAGRSLRDVPRLTVVDGHCHLGPYGAFWQPYNDAAGLVRTMDRIGIEQACVFASLAIALDVRAGNDLTFAAARAFPDRLLPYAVPDPNRGERAVAEELQRCFDAGARGVKLHTQLAAYPFDGPGYAPAFVLADAHRLPLISHGTGSPETLRRVARAHPLAHFVVAHAGAGLSPSSFELVQVAREEPNVYLDLTSSVGRFGAFEAMVEAAGAGKLTYGSDMPWMCASHQIGRVLLARIPEDAQRRILGGTLTSLLATRR